MNERKPKRSAKVGPAESTGAALSAGVDFEASIRRLGEIVEALEEGQLPLEDSLKLFEEGVGLARKSQKVLNEAEQRVEQLLSIDDSGHPITRELGSSNDD